jgi:aspartate kinase
MLVMKFGGTSVGDAAAIRRLVAIVRQAQDRHPLVVVSAMAGATNTLIACAQAAAAGKRDEAEEKLAALAARHATVAGELAAPEDLASLRAQLDRTFTEVRAALDEIADAGEVVPRLCDAVAARGELLSSPIVTAALRAADLPGVWFDIRPALITDADFTRAAIQFDETDPRLAAELGGLLANRLIPVTQGFIGSTVDGETTTIGRGGSDYSAAIIGAALDAEEIQIWTDVDGIMTTDPRIVPEAAKVRVISFAEAAELAYFGAKVLHPSTLLPAMAKQIPVSVRNSQRPEVEGTLIVKHAPSSRSMVKANAFKRGITVVDVTSDRMLMAYGFLARLFGVFARHQTAVDMVATSEVSVSMTLDDARNLDQIVAELQSLGEVEVERDRAVICLVGEGLKTTPGVAARIFSSIDRINVWMISHGASAINVSFIVADAELDQAVRALHDEFFHELDEETFEDRGHWSVVGGML